MTLVNDYDALLLDLDGTVWEGGRPIAGAVEAITASELPDVYVTNNASRGPEEVARMLESIGLHPPAEQVVTSAQAGVKLALADGGAGARALILGVDSLREIARAAGLDVVESAAENPDVVIQGHDPRTGWAELSEAALAIRAGARFYATNLDTTLPMQRGLMVGNGSMVAAVVSATGVEPVSAGKPEATMFHVAARHVGATRPLAVGDRLNTDIRGGNAAEMDTLHVLTGVSGMRELLVADEDERPTFIAEDLSGLFCEADELRPSAQGGFVAEVVDMEDYGLAVELREGDAEATSIQAMRTVLAAAWASEIPPNEVRAVGERAEAAAAGWKN
ncbi:HAD family hydrolase [Corynebacterium atypicum]|uniref:HAD family hydrolase n=1 Tax=Corynebacterium atypicum TaxID=191610 RepID=A0ABM5QN17_9CORY|nr:HAD-IIA family hydrolase [Corynebacterium atypicum]AIG64189.1 HAD family hydrolase [Corynebacterium atypicum]